ncbi:hypothetical protein BX666DRAFT_1814995, partial [Dichotomocladium elegans]
TQQSLDQQLQSVLSQTVVAETIWIVCDSETRPQIEDKIIDLTKSRKYSMIKTVIWESNEWLQLALRAPSDYIWILSENIIPGRQYLERMLRLSFVDGYRQSLLGTQAISFKFHQNGDLECMNNIHQDVETANVTQVVDMISKLWFVRRSWLASVKASVTKEPKPHLLGYSLSRSLAVDADIPSVIIPTEPGDRNYIVEYLEDPSGQASSSNLCDSIRDHLKRVRVHDLDIGYGRHTKATGDNGFVLLNENIHDLTRLITLLRPRLMIHMAHNGPVLKGIQTARDITKVPSIALPPRDIHHAFWMASLPIQALEKWNAFSIKLVVVTDRRPEALARLLRSAVRAHYFGDSVDLAIVMEQSSDRVTQTFVNTLQWPHGTKYLRHRITKVNQMPIHVESWYPASDHEYAVLLDQNIELSEMFYEWAKYAILKYRYSPSTPKDAAHLMGISLYSPRIIETDANERKLFNPSQILVGAGFDPQVPYRMQAVTSAGAVFFPEHWREFHDYIGARLTDMNRKQLQNISIPNARSSQWVNSWRRYMDELMYMRSYTLLYPNFEDHVSLSTYHFEPGKHVMVDFSQAALLLRVPLMDSSMDLRQMLPRQMLPDWQRLPLLDMWGNIQQMETLWQTGVAFQRQVSACTPLTLKNHMHDPSDMLCPPANLIEVPVTSEQDPIPEFSTRVVAVVV